MTVTYGKFKLDVDVEKTRKYYKTADFITDGCSCDGCANFEKAADIFPNSVKQLFEELGADPKKADDLFVCCSEDNGAKLRYMGSYLLWGTILTGESTWEYQQMDDNTVIGKPVAKRFSKIAEGYSVSFAECKTIGELIMDFNFCIPWVLDKPNGYK